MKQLCYLISHQHRKIKKSQHNFPILLELSLLSIVKMEKIFKNIQIILTKNK
jgi:hypothetical protein